MERALFHSTHGVISRYACLSLLTLAILCAVGCGGTVTTSGGSTSVTVLSSSTANDQLSEFDMVLKNLQLTDKSGNTVNLITAPVSAEFMHVDGTSEPLFTASVPQGTYTSATASVGTTGFGCVVLNSTNGGLQMSYFGDELTSTPNVTVNLPAPITVTGSSMTLSLDLLVSQSASWAACEPNGIGIFSITPTFDLAPLTLSSSPTSSQNGLQTGLKGLVASADATANSFTVTAADGVGCVVVQGEIGCRSFVNGPAWQVVSSAGTVFQGISGFSQLAAGMPVEMDAALQPDGALLAERVAVYDTNTVDLTAASGPLLAVSGAWPAVDSYTLEEQGPLSVGPDVTFNFSSAVFRVSDYLKNVAALPFKASFSATNMVAGQHTYNTTHATSLSIGPTYVPATTITLIAQTINATVSAVGSEGGFTTYTVTLAPYDLFPALATQSGQYTLLTDPSSIVVYADSNTQMLSTNPIAAGSVVRFYGLVFNDNGALRMDCSQINDGVEE